MGNKLRLGIGEMALYMGVALLVNYYLEDASAAGPCSMCSLEWVWGRSHLRKRAGRILLADGESDYDSTPEMVIDAFCRLSRYIGLGAMTHVGPERLQIGCEGIGSGILPWEKPGDRQVVYDTVAAELERNGEFTYV